MDTGHGLGHRLDKDTDMDRDTDMDMDTDMDVESNNWNGNSTKTEER